MAVQLFGISILLFAIYAFMNYDPAVVHNFLAPPDVRETQIRNEQRLLGTGIPYTQQFWNFWKGLILGDCEVSSFFSSSCNRTFGVGWEGSTFGRPIDDLIAKGTFNTMILFLSVFVFYSIVGVALGIIAGLKPNGTLDFLIRVFANISFSVPSILFSIYVLRISLDPNVSLLTRDASNRHEIEKLDFYGYFFKSGMNFNEMSGLDKFWIPVAVAGLISSVFVFRLIRGLIIKESRMLYVRTAKAKGLKPKDVIVRHIFPNIIPKAINAIAVTIPASLTTTAMVEFVFDYPGLAQLMVVSAKVVDIPVLLAGSLVLSFITMLMVTFLDLLSILTDPRQRLN